MDRDNRRLFEHVFENSSFDGPGSSECRSVIRTDSTSREYFTRDILEYLENNCEAFSLTETESLTDNHVVSKHKSLLQLLNWAVNLGIFRFALVTNTENCAAQWVRHKIYPVAASDSELLFPLDQLKHGIKGYCDEEWLNAPSRLHTSKQIYNCFLVTPPTQPNAPWQSQEEVIMTNPTIATKAQFILAGEAQAHSKAALAGVKIELGRTAIQLIKAQIKPRMPAMVQMVMDTPVADLAIATSCSVIATIVTVDPRAKILSEAMLTVAYSELLQKLQLPEMINGVLNAIPTQMFAALAPEQQAE